MLRNVFKETYRVLVNGGRACINVANLGRKPYIPLSDYISQMMIEIGFNMRPLHNKQILRIVQWSHYRILRFLD